MALKDLVGTKSALAEDAIESIVRGLVTYDDEAHEVALTPDGMRLGNRAKLLVYLTALLGWPFITEASVASDAKPADIEEATGIAGGSLRPLLRQLLEERLLTCQKARYAVRSTSIAAISAELAAPGRTTARRRAPTRRRKASAAPAT
jgi:hypothetical protein